ncbi:hypothetical protein WN982_35575 [Paraburkholderia sp. IMGN_8]|uniref:hypothetical protein n=1 Tax=Paraburkholderia sp. IMGN_8 TaxID=3136564 RepID=UPI003100AD21
MFDDKKSMHARCRIPWREIKLLWISLLKISLSEDRQRAIECVQVDYGEGTLPHDAATGDDRSLSVVPFWMPIRRAWRQQEAFKGNAIPVHQRPGAMFAAYATLRYFNVPIQLIPSCKTFAFLLFRYEMTGMALFDGDDVVYIGVTKRSSLSL